MTPLQRLRALLDASTKGPWSTDDDWTCEIQSPRGLIAKFPLQNRTDRDFIAAARNQMDRLLAVAEAAEAFDEFPSGAAASRLHEAVRALQSTENTDD